MARSGSFLVLIRIDLIHPHLRLNPITLEYVFLFASIPNPYNLSSETTSNARPPLKLFPHSCELPWLWSTIHSSAFTSLNSLTVPLYT